MLRRHLVVEVSTLFGLATVATAVDAGLLGERPEERTLVHSLNAPAPEARAPLTGSPGFAGLAARFGRVESWNQLVAPHHPSRWRPAASDRPILERLVRERWDLRDVRVELVVESLHASPAAALVGLFEDADLHVYADGLMAYGPSRHEMPMSVVGRVRSLLHLDLLPGVRPRLLHETGVEPTPLPAKTFRAVVADIAQGEPDLPPPSGGTALVLGQYLGQLGLLAPGVEQQLHQEMLAAVAAAGMRRAVFKPHPTASHGSDRALEAAASRLGLDLVVFRRPILAEVLMHHLGPEVVVSTFSTGLATARSHYGTRVMNVGAADFLAALRPHKNSNRVPATLCSEAVPSWDARSGRAVAAHVDLDDPAALQQLVDVVSYTMQPRLLRSLRPDVVAALRRGDGPPAHAVPPARLFALDLPGGTPQTPALRRLPAPVLQRLSTAAPRVAGWRARAARTAAALRKRPR